MVKIGLVGNNNPGAVARQTQAARAFSGDRLVEIGKAVGRVLLGICTLGGSEIYRFLKSRTLRQEATQPQDRRVRNHGTAALTRNANRANLFLARQFSERGGIHPMSFDKLFEDAKVEMGFDGKVDAKNLPSQIYNAILTRENALNLYEARDLAQEKIDSFFRDIKTMQHTIDQREDLSLPRKEEMKQLVLVNTNPSVLNGRAISPGLLGGSIQAFKAGILEKEHLPRLFTEAARIFGLDGQVEGMDKSDLMRELGGTGRFDTPPLTLEQMADKAREKISAFMEAKNRTLAYIDTLGSLSDDDRHVLKEMVIGREGMNSPGIVDQLLAGRQAAFDYMNAISQTPPDTANILNRLSTLQAKTEQMAKAAVLPGQIQGADEKTEICGNLYTLALKSSPLEKEDLQNAHTFLSGEQGTALKGALTALTDASGKSGQKDLQRHFSSLLRHLMDIGNMLETELGAASELTRLSIPSMEDLPEEIKVFAEEAGLKINLEE